MTAWHWLRRLFVVDAPPLPELGAEASSVVQAAAESRRTAERVERLAREQEQRMRELESRLRLYERRPADRTSGTEGVQA